MKVLALSGGEQETRRAPLPQRLRSGGETFLSALRRSGSAADQQTSVQTVQSGDTLWGICAANLEEQGLSTSNRAIYDAVQQVAASNRLENPDLIMPGQQIRLDAIRTAGQTTARSAVSDTSTVAVPPLMPRGMTVSELATRQRLMDQIDADSSAVGTLAGTSPARLAEYGQLATKSPWSQILGAPARLTSEFGMREDPFSGEMRHHDGIDLAAPTGTSVYPMASGRVTFSGWQGGYGQTVVVEHADGTETVYAHTSKNLVKEGQRVSKTTAIAAVGSTGRSTGPHLHFEVRQDGEAVDPTHVLTSGLVHVAQAL